METLNRMVGSRKFWYAFAMLIMVLFSENFGICAEKMENLVLLGIALIAAQGLADCKCKM